MFHFFFNREDLRKLDFLEQMHLEIFFLQTRKLEPTSYGKEKKKIHGAK